MHYQFAGGGYPPAPHGKRRNRMKWNTVTKFLVFRTVRILRSNVSISQSDDDDVPERLSRLVQSEHDDGTNQSSSSSTTRIISGDQWRVVNVTPVRSSLSTWNGFSLSLSITGVRTLALFCFVLMSFFVRISFFVSSVSCSSLLELDSLNKRNETSEDNGPVLRPFSLLDNLGVLTSLISSFVSIQLSAFCRLVFFSWLFQCPWHINSCFLLLLLMRKSPNLFDGKAIEVIVTKQRNISLSLSYVRLQLTNKGNDGLCPCSKSTRTKEDEKIYTQRSNQFRLFHSMTPSAMPLSSKEGLLQRWQRHFHGRTHISFQELLYSLRQRQLLETLFCLFDRDSSSLLSESEWIGSIYKIAEVSNRTKSVRSLETFLHRFQHLSQDQNALALNDFCKLFDDVSVRLSARKEDKDDSFV